MNEQTDTTDLESLTTRVVRLEIESERMAEALRSIRTYAENATIGTWRFRVAKLVDQGLNQ